MIDDNIISLREWLTLKHPKILKEYDRYISENSIIEENGTEFDRN